MANLSPASAREFWEAELRAMILSIPPLMPGQPDTDERLFLIDRAVTLRSALTGQPLEQRPEIAIRDGVPVGVIMSYE